ncbi:maleylpyruvate isomerase family mycothiol-dependent enzyme [Streptomyces sp. NPDC056161]|uniref:maleylpyruvate isomerase family mycothiol-dependent enzyme n=1 Tax=Streptomyces sp. NPDC056161 TaxID=3345732 RepID=UPI0035D7DB2E
MTETPAFEDLLALIQDRSAALRSSVADSADLDVRVPSCPDWSLRDLVEHITEVHRFWAAAVAAGPSEKPPTVAPADATLPADPLARPAAATRELIAARSAAATRELIAALRAAGPALGCWTWWGDSDVPKTSGAVARHQVQEAAVHAFDAQLATGTLQPVPTVVALDGIAEFVGVSHGTAGPWPHEPTRIGLHATEGKSWLIDLTESGSHLIDGRHEADADVHGSASNLLLALHRRLPLERGRPRRPGEPPELARPVLTSQTSQPEKPLRDGVRSKYVTRLGLGAVCHG